MRLIIIAFLIMPLLSPVARCETNYVAGEVAVIFKADTKEEDAVNFVKKLNLEILRKIGFEPPYLHFNIENNADTFIKEIRKESFVSSAVKGETLELNGRKGTVVRVKFKQNTGQAKIEETSLKYRNRKEVIGWRYYRNEAPSMIIKVPAGKERDWLKILSGPEYKNMVDSAMLMGLDI